ncbi:iron-containing alcohol dehydrogenase [Paenibacillus thalictri]|uniref:Iron-containing alcohol dehydrogenase n=1 Tax=Paenibacillus thalictri TaxID=2527873 RepID=A0A4Q9DL00_9BACL|nr:iron-containing alcohol dehydrogenase [Paenibacillus thalictri]TBL75669.1 iron-containing alcohol dehydrogenase [Paenibacillus thalictri]
MRNYWDFFSTERIIFGNGSIQRLDAALKSLKAKHVLLITDPGIVKSGILSRVEQLLKSWEYELIVYDGAIPEPPIEKAVECFEFAKSQMNIDAIIGLGGGSSIDLAKIVALLLEHGGHPRQYFGENAIPHAIAPLIAIPTTAGTGSEVTSVAVVTDTQHNIKVGISNNFLRPKIALLDPELTVELPPYVTACSGIDALAHAVEAYMATDFKYIRAEGEILFQGSNPISDTLALQAIQLICRNLVVAVQQGANIEARSNMLQGSLLAGMAFSNAGTAAAHALAYPLGGLTKSPHGELTGLLLPYVMSFNAEAQPKKMRSIAHALALPCDHLTNKEVAALVVRKVMELLESIGLPTKLSSIGLKRETIPEVADSALKIDRLIRNNPRTPNRDGMISLLEAAF